MEPNINISKKSPLEFCVKNLAIAVSKYVTYIPNPGFTTEQRLTGVLKIVSWFGQKWNQYFNEGLNGMQTQGTSNAEYKGSFI